MILYNITIKVDHSIAVAYKDWMLREHMPEILATGCFNSSRLMRLLEVDDSEGPTFAAQFTASNQLLYEQYIAEFSAALRVKSMEKWGNKFIAFRSVMEEVV